MYSKFYAWTGWVYGIGAEGPFGTGHDEEYINDHLQFPELAMGENLHTLYEFGAALRRGVVDFPQVLTYLLTYLLTY